MERKYDGNYDRKYVRWILNRLQCSKARREEIRKQLQSEILNGVENGEKPEDVWKRMGSPYEIAKEFNQSFSEEEKKKFRRERLLRRCGAAAAILLFLAAAAYWLLPRSVPLEQGGVFQAQEVQERAEQTVLLLGEGSYDEIRAYASDAMQPVLAEEKMDEIKANFGPDWGDFQSFGNLYMAQVRQMGSRSAVVQVYASYEQASITYTLSFDTNLELIGLWMK